MPISSNDQTSIPIRNRFICNQINSFQYVLVDHAISTHLKNKWSWGPETCGCCYWCSEKAWNPKSHSKWTHTQYKPYHSFTVIIVLMIFWGIPGKPWLPFIHGPGMICFTYDQWRLRLWWWDRPSWVTWSNKFQNVGVYPNLILNSKIWIQRVSNHNSNVARAQIFGLYDKLWSDM